MERTTHDGWNGSLTRATLCSLRFQEVIRTQLRKTSLSKGGWRVGSALLALVMTSRRDYEAIIPHQHKQQRVDSRSCWNRNFTSRLPKTMKVGTGKLSHGEVRRWQRTQSLLGTPEVFKARYLDRTGAETRVFRSYDLGRI